MVNVLCNQQRNIYQKVAIRLFFKKLKQKRLGFVVTTLIPFNFCMPSLQPIIDHSLPLGLLASRPLLPAYHQPSRSPATQLASCHRLLATTTSTTLIVTIFTLVFSTIVGNFWYIQNLENYILKNHNQTVKTNYISEIIIY